MEDVLRKLHLKKHIELQQRRKDRQLNLQEPKKRQRIHKGIWEDYRPLLQDFDLSAQIHTKRQMQFGNDFLLDSHRYKVKTVVDPSSQREKSVSLPPINNKQHRQIDKIQEIHLKQEIEQLNNQNIKNPERLKARKLSIYKKYQRKRLTKLFRACVYSVLFIRRLLYFRKQTLLRNRQLVRSYVQDNRLLDIIEKMVNKYYAVVLEQQLLKYLELLNLKIKQPKIMLEKQILNMLYFMSKKLAQSTIIQELISFLVLISGQNSFFPSDYLTPVEAFRLQFNQRYGFIQFVTYEQTRMIIAVCVGLKIFCSYVLYRPWYLKLKKSPISPQEIIHNFEDIRKIIHGASSIFYYIIMEEFCDKVQLTPELKPGTLKKMNIGLQPSIDIFPLNYRVKLIESPWQIFPNQKKKLYLALKRQNPDLFQQMKENIIQWLDRIVKASETQRQNRYKQRKKQIKKEQKQIIQKIIEYNKKNNGQEEYI